MNGLPETDSNMNPDDLGYTPLTPITGGSGGCLCCGLQHETLPMQAIIAVGFGFASLTRDGETIWEETAQEFEECLTVEQAEAMAAADPRHDWRIHLVAPLSERHYQRQGEKHWVLYEKGIGFA